MSFKSFTAVRKAPHGPEGACGAGTTLGATMPGALAAPGMPGQVQAPVIVTTRKFVKEAHAALAVLGVSQLAALPDEARNTVQELRSLLESTAQLHTGATEAGRLYSFLTEDVHVQLLHDAAARVRLALSAAAASTSSPALAAAAGDVAQKLASSTCALPMHQHRMVEEFKALCKPFDPTGDVPDRLQKQAEQLVREVVREVHGPFWSEELLDRELTQLERAAAKVDPLRNRRAAAAIKLLASAVMSLSGDDDGAGSGSESESPLHDSGRQTLDDPFSLPAFNPALALMSSPKARILTITMYEEDGNGALLSPKTLPHLNVAEHLQQLQLQAAAREEAAAAAAAATLTGGSRAAQASSQQQALAAGTAAAGTGTEAGSRLQLQTGQQQQQQQQQQQSHEQPARPQPLLSVSAGGVQQQQHNHQHQQQSQQEALPSPSKRPEHWTEAATMLDDFLARNSNSGGTTGSALQPGSLRSFAAAGSRGAGSVAGAGSGSGAHAARSSLTGGVESSAGSVFHAHMRLSPEGVEKVAAFLESSSRVRGLSLAHNWIGDAGVKRLCRAVCLNRSLRTLELPDNRITDEGAAEVAALLMGNTRLTTLQLGRNKIGDAGAVKLAQALEVNGTLESLSLHDNAIGSEGCQALVAALQVNRALRHLEFLPGNCAPPQDVKALTRAAKRNRRFSIRQLFGRSKCL